MSATRPLDEVRRSMEPRFELVDSSRRLVRLVDPPPHERKHAHKLTLYAPGEGFTVVGRVATWQDRSAALPTRRVLGCQ